MVEEGVALAGSKSNSRYSTVSEVMIPTQQDLYVVLCWSTDKVAWCNNRRSKSAHASSAKRYSMAHTDQKELWLQSDGDTSSAHAPCQALHVKGAQTQTQLRQRRPQAALCNTSTQI